MKIDQLISFYYDLANNLPAGFEKPKVDFDLGNKKFINSIQSMNSFSYVDTKKLHYDSGGFVDKHGIYIFFDSDTNEVIYLGKADRATISKRVWGFFKTAPVITNDDTCTFPDLVRKVNRECNKSEALQHSIRNGELKVVGIGIEKQWYASFFEAAGLAYLMNIDGKLPPVNLTF